MTLREFIKQIGQTKEELLDKEIVVQAENGLLLPPTIKFVPKDITNPILDGEHIDKVLITIR